MALLHARIPTEYCRCELSDSAFAFNLCQFRANFKRHVPLSLMPVVTRCALLIWQPFQCPVSIGVPLQCPPPDLHGGCILVNSTTSSKTSFQSICEDELCQCTFFAKNLSFWKNHIFAKFRNFLPKKIKLNFFCIIFFFDL